MYWFVFVLHFFSIFSFFLMKLYLFLNRKNILDPGLDKFDLLSILHCIDCIVHRDY